MTHDTAALETLRAELRTRFTAVAERHGLAVRGVRDEADGHYPQPISDALSEGHAVGAALPTEYGGLGLGLAGLAVVLEELAAADIGDMVPILTSMAAIPLAQHGSEELRREILPAIASGNQRLAFAVTEREAGSNVFAASTRAVADGNDFVLTGEKHYISAVDLASAVLLLARTTSREECTREGLDPSAGLSMFVVDRDSMGLSWERMALPRMRSVAQYALRLDRVRVPASRVVGARGFGVLPLLDALNIERILIPALILGATRWLLGIAIEHVKERRVFGDVPIGRYQAVQHPLAETFLRVQGLRLLLDRATETYDSGANPLDVSLPTAAARFAAVEVAEAALGAAGDALGARGFEPDIGLLGFAQMIRVFKSTPVSSPVMLNFVAEHHLGLPRSS
jgi:acyl-CoA dehydrogenase